MRILTDGEWYEAVSPSSLYEDDFERVVLSRARLLYPGYHSVLFKKLVQSDMDSARPDMALIDIQYRSWWVVEIEMAYHSLYHHVLPQVETLSSAVYGDDEADYLVSQNNGLDCVSLIDMMKGIQPRVLVVVNCNAPDWIEPLSKFNAILQVVEVFRSDKNRHMVRINGESPSILKADIVSPCHLDTIMPRLLLIESPASLGISHGERVEIELEGGITEWERIDSRNGVWLSPLKRNPLRTPESYQIVRDSTGALHFERVLRRRE